MDDSSNKYEELESLEGLERTERLEKAVRRHIHSLNSPLMIAQGYLPEAEGESLKPGALEKIQKSLKKIDAQTKALRKELLKFQSSK